MEVFGIGIGELLLIAVVALVILGPERLPEAARTLGRAVAELRKATEPAREVWTELTSEIEAGARTVKDAAGSLQSPASTRELPTATGNPWEVHPVFQKMTPEEQELFSRTGEMPAHLASEMSAEATRRTSGHRDGVSPGGVPAIDYPMPHEQRPHAPRKTQPLQDIDYPEPS